MSQAEKIKNQVTNNQGKAPQQQKANQTIQTLVQSMKEQFKRALPKHLDEDRMVRLLLTTLSKNPKLRNANQTSFLASSMEAAQLGLEPNTSLGECFIIPYENKKTKEVMAEFQIGYKGILKLAHNTKQYKSIYAEPVYANDKFSYKLGLFKDLVHEPADIPEGPPTHYYAVYHLQNGGYDFKVISTGAIRAHAQKYSKSYSYSSSPWQTDFDSMALKTVLLAAMKFAPKSIEVARALEADGTTKLELSENMSDVIDVDYQEVHEVPEDYIIDQQPEKDTE